MKKLIKLITLNVLITTIVTSTNVFAYKIIPAESVHESITAMAVKCMKSKGGQKPIDCKNYREIKEESFNFGDYVKGLEPLFRSVSWPDDPTREFTEFSGALATGAKVYLKSEAGCPRGNGYNYKIDENGLFCSSHFGQLQFFHSQAATTSEKASETYKKILDWALFLYEVSIDEIDTTDDYCKFWRQRSSAISSVMAPNGFKYCDKRFSLKKLITLRHPYYSAWTVGTLLNFTCRNPLSSKTCTERIGNKGKIWAKQNATGALLHLIQDSYSQSHTERGVCENDTDKNKVISKIECSPIKRYYAYGVQDEDLHGEADFWPKFSPSCNSEKISMDPVLATAQIMWKL